MEVLRFDDLSRHLLLKNGNYLYKVPYGDGFAVLKLYYGSRSGVERLCKTIDNVLLYGQTSFMPKARLKTELDAMRVWREAGFRVFDIYEDVKVEGLPEGGYALYEYVPGRHFHKLLPDESVPLEERRNLYRKFLREWHRRHRLAVERREPRLIHENGDLKHVMDCNGELVWFDFEVCFRFRSHVEDLVAREILAYVRHLARFLNRDRFEIFFKETMTHYPGREFLDHVHTVAFRNRNPIIRASRWLDRLLRKKSRKPDSKYNIALRIRDYLATH